MDGRFLTGATVASFVLTLFAVLLTVLGGCASNGPRTESEDGGVPPGPDSMMASGGASGGDAADSGAPSGGNVGSGGGAEPRDASSGDVWPAGDAASGTGDPSAVEQWHPIDISLGGTSISEVTDAVTATFSGPGGEKLVLPGFFDGAGWRVRFSPTALGQWSYATTSSVPSVNGKIGALTCVPNQNPKVHGRVIVDAAHPHDFAYEDGTPYLLMGFEADWLALIDFGDPQIAHAKSLIDMYASLGFNQVLMNVFAYDTAWKSGNTSADDYGPPAQMPWKGTFTAIDYSAMNPVFFQSFDRVMQHLFDSGVVAHVMFKVYNKKVNWPAKGSGQDDLYFMHVLARYQAYPNIVWNFSKESFNEPDTGYKSDRLRLIRSKDAYHHPVSTHADDGYVGSAASSGLLDFRTDETLSGWYNTALSRRNATRWPVLNAEYGYEIGNDGGRTYGQADDKLTVFKSACEVVMAGGYINYYYTYHAWDVVRPTEVPGGLSYYGTLHQLLSSTKWSELNPADDLISNPAAPGRHCLANVGKEYIVYLAGAGATTLTVAQVAAGTMLRGKWVNLITGAEQEIAPLGNGKVTLTNPWSAPAMAALH